MLSDIGQVETFLQKGFPETLGNPLCMSLDRDEASCQYDFEHNRYV